MVRRCVLAVVLSALVQAGIVACTANRVPWRLGGGTTVREFSATRFEDGMYWHVLVKRSGVWWTVVESRPAGTIEGAEALARQAAAIRSMFIGKEQVGAPTIIETTPSGIPSWSGVRARDVEPYRDPRNPGRYAYVLEEHAMGWPVRCVRGEIVLGTAYPALGEDGAFMGSPRQVRQVRGIRQLRRRDFSPLPYFPIWQGAALDVLVLAVPIVVLQWGVGAWRVSRRRRSGRCAVCAYDRAGIGAGETCPECGHVPRG